MTRWWKDAYFWGLMIALSGAGLIALGDWFGWEGLKTTSGFIGISGFCVAAVVPMAVKERVLAVGYVPGAVSIVAIWLTILPEIADVKWFVLGPITTVPMFLFAWIPVAYWLVRCARRVADRSILGPATDTLSMAWLTLPWVMAAVVLPNLFDPANESAFNETVSAIGIICIGLLWSGLLSRPFARFVYALDRSSHASAEQGRAAEPANECKAN